MQIYNVGKGPWGWGGGYEQKEKDNEGIVTGSIIKKMESVGGGGGGVQGGKEES